MITSKVKYLGNLRTTSNHIRSNESIITDAPIDNNGQGKAFSPTDMVANSLATCMITIMAITARDKNIAFNNVEAEVSKVMKDKPRAIDEIIIKFIFTPFNYSEKEKTILINAAKNCPVALSLSPSIKQKLSFGF